MSAPQKCVTIETASTCTCGEFLAMTGMVFGSVGQSVIGDVKGDCRSCGRRWSGTAGVTIGGNTDDQVPNAENENPQQ